MLKSGEQALLECHWLCQCFRESPTTSSSHWQSQWHAFYLTLANWLSIVIPAAATAGRVLRRTVRV